MCNCVELCVVQSIQTTSVSTANCPVGITQSVVQRLNCKALTPLLRFVVDTSPPWRRSVVVSALASISVLIDTGPGYYLDG